MDKKGLTADDLRELSDFLEGVQRLMYNSSGLRSINGGWTEVGLLSMDDKCLNLLLEESICDGSETEWESDCGFYELSVPRSLLANKGMTVKDKVNSVRGWTQVGREKAVTSHEVDEAGVEFTKTVTETWKGSKDRPAEDGSDVGAESTDTTKKDDDLFGDDSDHAGECGAEQMASTREEIELRMVDLRRVIAAEISSHPQFAQYFPVEDACNPSDSYVRSIQHGLGKLSEEGGCFEENINNTLDDHQSCYRAINEMQRRGN